MKRRSRDIPILNFCYHGPGSILLWLDNVRHRLKRRRNLTDALLSFYMRRDLDFLACIDFTRIWLPTALSEAVRYVSNEICMGKIICSKQKFIIKVCMKVCMHWVKTSSLFWLNYRPCELYSTHSISAAQHSPK